MHLQILRTEAPHADQVDIEGATIKSWTYATSSSVLLQGPEPRQAMKDWVDLLVQSHPVPRCAKLQGLTVRSATGRDRRGDPQQRRLSASLSRGGARGVAGTPQCRVRQAGTAGGSPQQQQGHCAECIKVPGARYGGRRGRDPADLTPSPPAHSSWWSGCRGAGASRALRRYRASWTSCGLRAARSPTRPSRTSPSALAAPSRTGALARAPSPTRAATPAASGSCSTPWRATRPTLTTRARAGSLPSAALSSTTSSATSAPSTL